MKCQTCNKTKRQSNMKETAAGHVCQECMQKFKENTEIDNLQDLDEEKMAKAIQFAKKRQDN